MTDPTHLEFVRRLFGKDQPEADKPASQLHVPHEGPNPEPAPDDKAETRQFVKDLFDRA